MLPNICNGHEMPKRMQGAPCGEGPLAPPPSLSPVMTRELAETSGQPSPVALASHTMSLSEGSAKPEMPQEGPLTAMLSSPALKASTLMQQGPTLVASQVPSSSHIKQSVLQDSPLQPELGTLQQEEKPSEGPQVPPTALPSSSPDNEPGWLPPAPELLRAGPTLAGPSTIESRRTEHPQASGEMVEASRGSLEQTSSLSMHAPQHAPSAIGRLKAPHVSPGRDSSRASGGPLECGLTEGSTRYTFLPGVDREPIQAVAQPPGHDSLGSRPAVEKPALPSSAAASSTHDAFPTTRVPECPFPPGGVSDAVQSSPGGTSLPPARDIPMYPFRPRGGMYPAVPLELLGSLRLPSHHPPDTPPTALGHIAPMTDEMDKGRRRPDHGSPSHSAPLSRSVPS